MKSNNYKDKLRNKMDTYAHLIYEATKSFPEDELYGVTSQLRRSAISVVLNYIEGYGRIEPAVQLNCYQISYGSLRESDYLVNFAYKRSFINQPDFKLITSKGNEIGAIL